jgi:hypothetical protein
MIPLKRNEIKILLRTLKAKKYKVFTRPYELNIVGRRTDSTKPNKFDDWIYVFYKNQYNKWKGYKSEATTDAGRFWLNQPMRSEGTALLKEGQYLNAYNLVMHNGKYLALTQSLKPVTVYRDYNRDVVLDFDNGEEQTGFFGINIHRADSTGTTKYIGQYSAGCQVFADADDFNKFIDLAERHKEKYGNVFTYTLIDERAYVRKLRRRVLFGSLVSVAIVGLAIGIYKLAKK